ncbi:MAG: ORF6C domain-containing protein [Ardenticatenaceae bacterium]|nr:ORF6C domain-containing protein [Ardenticatenaceae bacterium]
MIAVMGELAPVEQKQVLFYEDEVTAVRMADGTVYVPIRPLCDYLGVSWQGQHRRITDDLVMSEVVMSVNVTLTDIEPNSRRPHSSEMLCLPLDYLNGWLFGINPKRVKDEAREQVLRYQRECYRVLADAFQNTAVVSSASSSLVHVREMGLAIVRMAEEQMAFDRRLDAAEGQLEIVGQLAERLTAVEEKLTPSQLVTEEQASQISQSVKTVAIALGKKSQRNEFGAVYGELYRRYGITSYKSLPAHKFEDALNFLTEWHQEIVTGTAF